MPPSIWTRLLFVLLPIVATGAASEHAQSTSKSPRGDVAAALADSARPDWDKEKDADRKPATPAAQITFSGRYAGDEAASKMPAGTHVPPEFIYAIEDEGTVLHLLQTFRDPNGKVQRNEWRGPVDGKPHPVISESPHSLALSRTPQGDLIITGFSADGSKQDDEICSLLEDRRGFTCRDLNTTSKQAPPKFLYMFRRID